MLTLEQVKDIESRENIVRDYLTAKKKNWLSPEEQEKLPKVTNEERSAAELFYWHNEKPSKYFLYINTDKKIATTWIGEELGRVSFGREYCGNMGDKRQSVRVYGVNGQTYSGTYYKGAGDYARVKAIKNN